MSSVSMVIVHSDCAISYQGKLAESLYYIIMCGSVEVQSHEPRSVLRMGVPAALA